MTESSRPIRLQFLVVAVLVLASSATPCPAMAISDPVLKTQIKSAVDVGLRHIRFQQQEDGSWDGDVRATAVAVGAFMQSHRRYVEDDGPFVREGLRYLAESPGPDDGFGDARDGGLTTSFALLALNASTGTHFDEVQKKALSYLLATLEDVGSKGADNLRRAPFVLLTLDSLGVDQDHPACISARAAVTQMAAEAGLCSEEEAYDACLAASLSARVRRSLADQSQVRALSLPASFLLVTLLTTSPADGLGFTAGEVDQLLSEIARGLVARQEFQGAWPAENACDWSCGEVEASGLAILTLSMIYR